MLRLTLSVLLAFTTDSSGFVYALWAPTLVALEDFDDVPITISQVHGLGSISMLGGFSKDREMVGLNGYMWWMLARCDER